MSGTSETEKTYDCTSCGACCRCFPIFASASDARREPRILLETRALPEHLRTSEHEHQLFPLPFHDACAFLRSDQLCRIYATRPEVCRRFQAGSPQCLEARRRADID